MTCAIKTMGLAKNYKERAAVLPLDLEIAQGEFFALLGENGAGKTTTIKMLSCLLEPTAGDALVCGHSILTEAEQVKQLISISPAGNRGRAEPYRARKSHAYGGDLRL